MIVEKQMECRLAGETEVLGEDLPQRHFRPTQNPTSPDPGLNPGRRDGKPSTNRLSYGAAVVLNYLGTWTNLSVIIIIVKLWSLAVELWLFSVVSGSIRIISTEIRGRQNDIGEGFFPQFLLSPLPQNHHSIITLYSPLTTH
jgi:sensor histidine kinase YesM